MKEKYIWFDNDAKMPFETWAESIIASLSLILIAVLVTIMITSL